MTTLPRISWLLAAAGRIKSEKAGNYASERHGSGVRILV